MQTQLLKGKIVENGSTIESIAVDIGINRSTFYRKMKNKGNTFTVEEMNKIVSVLHLNEKEATEIFFDKKSSIYATNRLKEDA